ncbi:MAG: DUF58 domain-containing protein, partial [Steroidobacteraceae bacterium]
MSLRRNALILILLIALLAILGQWNPDLARWWCMPCALLLLGLAYEGAALGRCALQLETLAPERWPLGGAREVQYALRQDSRLDLWVEVLLSAPGEFTAEPHTEILRLARGIPARAILRAAARRLGRYPWPAPAIRLGGPLRLAWWSRRASIECTVSVVPDIVDRIEQAAGNRSAGAERARSPGAGAEILQLREYRRGDPLRVIDWKASARRGRLISRDMSEDQHLEVIVAIDAGRASGLGAGDVDRLSLYVNIAARLAQRAA